MVKSAKLWQEIQLQYAKLQEDGDASLEASEALHPAGFDIKRATHVQAEKAQASSEKTLFYEGGWQTKHWVLLCCSMMVACEWVDRSVLSAAMQAMKEEFSLSDTQVGLMASASLWLSPFATGPVGRLADHVPRPKVLGVGITAWGACTFLTGSSNSFFMVVLCRLLAGLANCAGFPVAVSLLSDHFKAAELTTAMGYYNAGMSVGGLLGLAAGGGLITTCGWRWAFWVVSLPQLVVALLFFTSVPEGSHSKPAHTWGKDLKQLMALKAFICMSCNAALTGLAHGQGRFLYAFVERRHGVDSARIGLVMGPVLGVTGLLTSWGGGHAIDACVRRHGDHRIFLYLASAADFFGIIFAVFAILAPSFGLLVLFSTLNVAVSSLRQGEQTIVAELARGRRGTAQGLMETYWAIGMGLGPFAAGAVSDAISAARDCDESCALARSLLVFTSVGMGLRGIIWLVAASVFYGDVGRLNAELGLSSEPVTSATDDEAGMTNRTSFDPDAVVLGHSAVKEGAISASTTHDS